MIYKEQVKEIFNRFIREPYSKENMESIAKDYESSKKRILFYLRKYAKYEASKEELRLYNKRVHEREKYVDFRVGINKKYHDSHYFKYFKILTLLSNKLDEYIISDDYSKIINYLETLDINLNNNELKNLFYKYLDEIYSNDESNKIKEKINYIFEIYNCFLGVKNKNIKKEQDQFKKILEAKKYLNSYLLELSEEKLFLPINKTKRNSCIKVLENYDKSFVLEFLEKEEKLLNEIAKLEIKKIEEISRFVEVNKQAFLEYHLLFNYDLKTVLSRARKYKLTSFISKITQFYNNYINQHLLVESSFYENEIKLSIYGQEYLVSKVEKLIIINYIKQNNFPKTHEMVNQILRKMILGQIELSSNKIYTKKS